MTGDPLQLEQDGIAAYRRGDLAQACDLFAAAEAAYQDGGSRLKAAEMANNRCVALIGLHRGTEAVAAVEETPLIFSQAGERSQEALALGNLAAALEAAGDLDRADHTYRRALDLLARTGDRSAESVTWQALSRLQLRRGDPLGAAASAQAALDSHPRPGLVRRILRRLLGRAAGMPDPRA